MYSVRGFKMGVGRKEFLTDLRDEVVLCKILRVLYPFLCSFFLTQGSYYPCLLGSYCRLSGLYLPLVRSYLVQSPKSFMKKTLWFNYLINYVSSNTNFSITQVFLIRFGLSKSETSFEFVTWSLLFTTSSDLFSRHSSQMYQYCYYICQS